METAWIMAGHANDSLELSPQQLIDCDSRSSGCKGGYLSGAYIYGTYHIRQKTETADYLFITYHKLIAAQVNAPVL